MKLTDIKEEIIINNDELTVVAINEARGTTRFAVRPSRGGMLNKTLRKGAAALTANPGLAVAGATLAVAGIAAYNKNKRNTVRLFAKDHRERTLYTKIINDLMKTGSYKKVREKHAGGGYMWELKRK